MHVELTYYNKVTKDALIDAIVAPSAGAANTVKENIGSVKNAGEELALNAQVFDTRRIAFDVTVSAAVNENKLVSLGPVPPQINTTWRAVAGYPLFGFWAQPITGWDDKNGDGILVHTNNAATNEVFVGPDPIFRGYSSPRYLASIQPGIDLFSHRLRIACKKLRYASEMLAPLYPSDAVGKFLKPLKRVQDDLDPASVFRKRGRHRGW